ncbi:hypothetical protein PNEG_00753 [Pneumocystis murina B123]|uniref:EF-hand domain-containing protein n=1 Tax=Pneumocystis murina (strain B123) TaxID=1069680 RepID=M7NV35_PNEMU|nr:hypothetical protein PNEG_00753 [Pneumocystis murina B123]EMR11157.1 hypothetical protein PNEG_00753 [Pneumocystis murina B123]
MPIFSFSALENGKNWMDHHMKNEHDTESYDLDTFFYLHDFNFNGHWNAKDFRRIYGLDNEDLTEKEKIYLEKKLLSYIDKNEDGIVTLDEFKEFIYEGNMLPDLGFDGHHEDFETEFNIHHIEVYHRNLNDNWKHFEDIEHLKKHNEILYKEKEILEEKLRNFYAMKNINIIIIPKKYLKK